MHRLLPAFMAAALAVPAYAQTADDPSQTHKKMYAKIAPSVVFVKGQGQQGSGVIVDKDGYILTSTTACGKTSTNITVQLSGMREVPGKVAGRVNDLELVIVKVEAKDLPAIELGDSDAAKVGSVAYAFGDSFGSIQMDGQVAISLGVVSGVYELEEKRGANEYLGPVLETTCAVNQSQDGGPLVDARGRLLGVISLNYHESRFAGVAVPVNKLKPDIERIIREHRTGVVSAPVREGGGAGPKVEPGTFGAEFDDDHESGLAVKRLTPKGPAERSGLKVGDVIREIDGARTLTRKRFDELLSKQPAGAKVKVRFLRGTKEFEAVVTLGRKIFY